MERLRLSPLSYLVLGVVAERESCTPYEMKRDIGRSIGPLWPHPHAQLYAEPARLARAGLLAVTVESGGRRRHRYRLTDQGRARLDAWLDDDAVADPELRDTALLKLMFLSPNTQGAERVRRLAVARAHEHRRRGAWFEQWCEAAAGEAPPGTAELHRLAGELERTAAAFWSALADRSGY
ncbi:PadR family transcriptional regulator [Pseudonocardia sp. KRD291]|uniref:PadR family transcriptional regulator n=1 Tax=Pseudonocardia sp. KRD291 TaxID=2792007 RepID=UPI001C4A65F3|nr:PadR family transcriptional regulator [Pseudonocardia sp. KRD291]MBW0102748.1 PadR family transcriptional regulator [Pseudonocardia sp. KRD291]